MKRSEIVKKNRRAFYLSGVFTIILIGGVLFYDIFGATVYMSILSIFAAITAMIVLVLPYLKEKGILIKNK